MKQHKAEFSWQNYILWMNYPFKVMAKLAHLLRRWWAMGLLITTPPSSLRISSKARRQFTTTTGSGSLRRAYSSFTILPSKRHKCVHLADIYIQRNLIQMLYCTLIMQKHKLDPYRKAIQRHWGYKHTEYLGKTGNTTVLFGWTIMVIIKQGFPGRNVLFSYGGVTYC